MNPGRLPFLHALRLLLFALAALAWLAATSFAQAAGKPLGFDDARHLLNRTSFAAGSDEITAFAKLTREQAVERLLAETRMRTVTAPPAWINEPFQSPRR